MRTIDDLACQQGQAMSCPKQLDHNVNDSWQMPDKPENIHCHSDRIFVTFLACPKKGDPKKGTPATLLVRAAWSPSVHFSNSSFGQVKHSGLGQAEMFNPQARSQPGKGRMGKTSS